MEEATVTIQSVDTKSTKKGNPFWLYHADDGKTYTCFSNTEHQLVQEDMQAGRPSKFKFETKQQGNYTNFVISQVAAPDGNYPQKEQKRKGTWSGGAKKDTRSIERQVALIQAVKFMERKMELTTPTDLPDTSDLADMITKVGEKFDDFLQAKKSS